MPCFVLDLDDTLVNTTRDLQGDLGRIPSLTLVDGAREFLERHGDTCVILSLGVESIQQAKIDVVGIREMVRHIVIVFETERKRSLLSRFASRSDLPASSVVVGDRLDQEIQIGNELGFPTVRMRLPDGKYCGDMPAGENQRPRYTVTDFYQFLALPIF